MNNHSTTITEGGTNLKLTQPKLRFARALILLLEINIYSIYKRRIDLRSAEEADPGCEKVESGDTDTFVVRLRVYWGRRCQEHCHVVR